MYLLMDDPSSYESLITTYRNNIGPEAWSKSEITFVGHSLGASIAESLLALKFCSGSDKCYAFTFDSPGIPSSFKEAYQVQPRIENQWTLNSVLNPINSLNRSCAGHFYSCGIGSRITHTMIFSAVMDMAKLGLRVVCQYVLSNIKGHEMASIREYLERSEITEASPDSYLVTNTLLSCVSKLRKYISWFNSNQASSPEFNPSEEGPVEEEAPVEEDFVINTEAPPDCEKLPESLDQILEKHAYCVDTTESWNRFWNSIDPSTDILIAFMGTTGVGKSSTVNHLAKIQSEQGIPQGGGVNSSKHPYVALWKKSKKERIFLIDWPGFGASVSSSSTENANGWIGDVDLALKNVKNAVVCVVFVTNSAPKDEEVKVLKKLADNFKLLVAINDSLDNPGHSERREIEWREREQEVVTYSASADKKNHRNTNSVFSNLESRLEDYVLRHRDHIFQEQKMGRAMERIDKALVVYRTIPRYVFFLDKIEDFRNDLFRLSTFNLLEKRRGLQFMDPMEYPEFYLEISELLFINTENDGSREEILLRFLELANNVPECRQKFLFFMITFFSNSRSII